MKAKFEEMPEDTKIVCDCNDNPKQAVVKATISGKEIYLCRGACAEMGQEFYNTKATLLEIKEILD